MAAGGQGGHKNKLSRRHNKTPLEKPQSKTGKGRDLERKN
jgi:hypothetical protein